MNKTTKRALVSIVLSKNSTAKSISSELTRSCDGHAATVSGRALWRYLDRDASLA